MKSTKHSLLQVFKGDQHWTMPTEWQEDGLTLGFAVLLGEATLTLSTGQKELGACSICFVSARDLRTAELRNAEALLWPLNPLWGIPSNREELLVLDETSAGVLYDVFFEHERCVEHQHVALQLIGHQMAALPQVPTLAPDGSLSLSVCEFMAEHLDDVLNLDFLADHFRCSKQKLMRVFKEEQGLSPMQKLAQLRIDKVKQTLQRSDMNISQVAASVGYADLPSFSHFFKKHTGLSPSEYRSQLQWLV